MTSTAACSLKEGSGKAAFDQLEVHLTSWHDATLSKDLKKVKKGLGETYYHVLTKVLTSLVKLWK